MKVWVVIERGFEDGDVIHGVYALQKTALEAAEQLRPITGEDEEWYSAEVEEYEVQ